MKITGKGHKTVDFLVQRKPSSEVIFFDEREEILARWQETLHNILRIEFAFVNDICLTIHLIDRTGGLGFEYLVVVANLRLYQQVFQDW